MNSEWLSNELSEYKKLYLDCANEVSLKYCVQSMIRMINGLCEMNDTLFYAYERKMLWGAMELFSKRCRTQIEKALQCTDAIDKNKMVKEIGDSIGEIRTIYSNMFESAGGMNYQMVKGQAVNAGTHEVSAKICTFFSSILEKLVKLFSENEQEFIFILNSKLQSIIQASILLDKRDVTGKVVIIYIPESALEKFDLISICLMHEAFHVLTQKERNRKMRYQSFFQSVLLAVRYEMLEEVTFFQMDDERNNEVKERLTREWFSDLNKKLFVNVKEFDGDYTFYGNKTTEKMEEELRECLMEINDNLETVLMDAVYGTDYNISYDVFKKRNDKVKDWQKIIQRNILHLLSGDTLRNILGALMDMFRECYADIACILTLSLRPEMYENAFKKSIDFKYDIDSYTDQERILRTAYVADAVKDCVPIEMQSDWESYSRKCRETYRSATFSDSDKDLKGRQQTKYYVKIALLQAIIDCYAEYLHKCARDFKERCDCIQELPRFRKQIEEVMRMDNQQCLMKVLSGTLNIDDIIQED